MEDKRVPYHVATLLVEPAPDLAATCDPVVFCGPEQASSAQPHAAAADGFWRWLADEEGANDADKGAEDNTNAVQVQAAGSAERAVNTLAESDWTVPSPAVYLLEWGILAVARGSCSIRCSIG